MFVRVVGWTAGDGAKVPWLTMRTSAEPGGEDRGWSVTFPFAAAAWPHQPGRLSNGLDVTSLWAPLAEFGVTRVFIVDAVGARRVTVLLDATAAECDELDRAIGLASRVVALLARRDGADEGARCVGPIEAIWCDDSDERGW